MIRRVLLVWPPAWMLVTAGLIFLFLHVMAIQHEMMNRLPPFALHDGNEFFQFIGIAFASMHGVYRVMAFHPAYRPGYHQWLCGTPWTSAKPLPLGPVHVVWQDAAFLALLVAVCWPRLGWRSFTIVHGFVVLYLCLLGFAHTYTQQKVWGYLTLFGLGFVVLFARSLPWFAGAVLVTYVIANLGLRAALAAFPWQDAAGLQQTVQAFKNAGKQPPVDNKTLGWPYDRIGPQKLDDVDPPWHFVIVTGTLLGWWLFVCNYQFRMGGDPAGGYFIYFLFLLGATIFRLSAYINGYAPPINVWGRLLTWRWIIPGYDKVFIAPILAVCVGVLTLYVPGWLNEWFQGELPVHPSVITPVSFVLTWWIIFGCPPTLKSWRLTGNHRIVPAVMNQVQQS